MESVETIEQYVQRRATVDISHALSRGWALVRDNLLLLAGATLLAWLISFVPVIGWLLAFVVLGGLDYLFLRRMRGETQQIGDVFAGFNLAFLNLVMCGLVKLLLICLGLIACIIPGIYLGVGYVFAIPLVIDKRMDFWPAMELSRQVVHRHWWSMFALCIVLALVAFAGFLVCGVGELVTIPLASAAFLYVYEDLFGAPVVAQ